MGLSNQEAGCLIIMGAFMFGLIAGIVIGAAVW
jgi:hypothetical protein